MKNLYEQLLTKEFKNIDEVHNFLKGKSVKILNNPNVHSYGKTGEIFTITNNNFLISTEYVNGILHVLRLMGCKALDGNNVGGNTIRTESLILIDFENYGGNKEEFIKKINEIEIEKEKIETILKLNRDKLGYLQETKEKVFNQEKFNKFQKMTASQKRKFVKELNNK